MLPICAYPDLKLYEMRESTRALARRVPCSELTALVLEMMSDAGGLDLARVQDWMAPDLEAMLDVLDLGEGSGAAGDLWRSKASFGNVLVYGDYDTDGISATVLAMEIFRQKAAQVRYFIPRRDAHGYGLNAAVLDQIADSGCDALVVVDCGTNDSAMLQRLKDRGLDVFVFDHHTVAGIPTFPTIVNPCIDGGPHGTKLCATAVLWCWAWKEGVISRQWLDHALDLVALATVADCMPLRALNRSLVRQGLRLMRTRPRRGLGALLDRLRIDRRQLSEEQLSMKVIPCLNAPGRIASADVAVRALLGLGSDGTVYECAGDLVAANRRRKTISERITEEIREDAGLTRHVMFGESWPVGVLSGVASRICSQRRSSVVLAAPVAGKIRGTLRVPIGGDAVAVLSQISGLLEAWGGHRYAAGFSVSPKDWDEVEAALERMLSEVGAREEIVSAIDLSPASISLDEWRAVTELGPFGSEWPCPRFYRAKGPHDRVEPLGKEGRHSAVRVDDVKILAFNAASDLRDTSGIAGWVYHPRLDRWRNEEQVQFILDYAVVI
ncbi:MAG: DHH family phosphoesterase [Synergistaceae bacterium]|nr:DHH family phosphoesterase [Synergistaceae bacterium]